MRSLGPVLRLPPAVAGSRARRRRPAGFVAAFALALVAVGPASGAPAAAPAAIDARSASTPALAAPRVDPPTTTAPVQASPPGTTTLISLSTNDGFAQGPSTAPSISENGRWVAFASLAPDLVANDTNNAQDAFLRDRRAGTTVRIPMPGGAVPPAGGAALDVAISADGSVVAFTYAPPPPTTSLSVPCSAPRVLLWHRETGDTELASLNADDGLHCGATAPSVSGDGRFVAFVGPVTNTAGVPLTQVWVRDMRAGSTALVSAGAGGALGSSNSRAPAIARDGSSVAFESDASNLSPGDSNEQTDVFVRTLPGGPTSLISVVPGDTGNGPSRAPAISADGTQVAFESAAQNMVAGASPGAQEVYVRDRRAGQTTLASTSIDGAPAKGTSGQASISGDGRIVAFASVVTDLVASGTDAILAAVAPTPPTEVYARDRVSGDVIRISEARGGGPAGLVNLQPSIGDNGRYVAFASNSPNLVRGDGNQVSDIFLRDLPPTPVLTPDPVEFGPWGLGIEGPPLAATLTNAGWGGLSVRSATISGPAAGDFGVAVDDCVGRVLRSGQSCQVGVTFAAGRAGDRRATLEVDHAGTRPPAAVALHGTGVDIPGPGTTTATLEIAPPVGRPGIVVIATGSGFPGNTELTLAWSRGITPTMAPIRTDVRGNFRVQVLVFHNDVIGTRDLVASPAGSVSFLPVATRFLVVESQSEPPRFEPGDPGANRPPTLVFRH
jgi:Tol biopolymer transport system component